MLTAILLISVPNTANSQGVVIDGDVVCKCRSGFLGKKCKADGSDGNQCNSSDKCWESNRNC